MAPRPHRFELAVLGVAVALLFVGILVVRSSASVGTAAAESPAQKASVLRSSVPRRPGGAARRTPGQLQPPQAGSAGWVTSTEPISVGGMDRSYLLVEPAPLPRTPVPVIVVLHGLAASPQFEEARTDFMPIVGPAVLVYPFGYQMSWNAGTCCGAAKDAGVNDVAFISGVVDKVLSDHPTSTEASQVFLVGYSNGGKMAWQMACQDPSQFAAIGVFGAVPAANCPTRQPVAAIEL
ncbi:MAG: alpha/beta hydrolase family esterase, partial [Acidimicrobiales bacterium]